MLIPRALACLLLSLTAACGGGDSRPAQSAAPASTSNDTASARGKTFAQAHCAACHAIDTGISPMPAAPSFADTANAPGLTAQTLRPWLRDSHNYPEIMNFTLAPAQIDDLTAYMLTLRRTDYRPPIQ